VNQAQCSIICIKHSDRSFVSSMIKKDRPERNQTRYHQSTRQSWWSTSSTITLIQHCTSHHIASVYHHITSPPHRISLSRRIGLLSHHITITSLLSLHSCILRHVSTSVSMFASNNLLADIVCASILSTTHSTITVSASTTVSISTAGYDR
jgi:hypothetical protein